MIQAVFTLGGLAAVIGATLMFAARRLPADANELIDRVDALLPQTQCAQCAFPGCRPYAAAIVNDGTPINRCAPGGDDTVRALAGLLGREPEPLDPEFGLASAPAVAVIDEPLCVGCARCLDVCPVDAILGAPRYMHTVIAHYCTGCELCIPACPVDCIGMESADPGR